LIGCLDFFANFVFQLVFLSFCWPLTFLDGGRHERDTAPKLAN
jgi:hypothetical protein